MVRPTVHDLSALLETHMPTWPKSAPPRFAPFTTVERDGSRMERMECTTHTGTHVDAPAHFLSAGLTVDRIPPSALVGSAGVLDLREEITGPTIPSAALARHWPKRFDPEIALLWTGWSARRAHTEEYLHDFPGVDPEGARWLADRGLKGVGTDTLSIDPFSNEQFEAHQILLGKGIWILEVLDHLDELKEEVEYTVIAAPLKIAEGSGAMARVFALEGVEAGGPGR